MKLKDTGLTFQDIKDKVDKYMIETYERFDFLAETAKDQYMYDENGTPYLDFYAGIAVNSAGNCNEKVVAAVKDQVEDIMHTFNYPYTIPQALLAEKICTTIGMDKIFYQNSGTEANEAMIKMARKYGVEKYGPEHYHIVTAINGFHGRTYGALSATGQPDNACQLGFKPMLPGFSYAEYNNLEDFKSKVTDNTIAIMIEPVQGEGGVHPATMEFMQGLRALCDEHDILLVCDEIQCGMGRTGNMFCYQSYDILPDVVCVAKALGNGLPIGAFLCREECAALVPGDHGSTYGGNPLVCAAANAVMDQFEELNLTAHVKEVGAYLYEQLEQLTAEFDCIKDHRGIGLMQGIELTIPVGDVIKKAQKEGLIIISASGNVIRFVPPLVIEKKHVDEMIAKLKKCLQ